MIVQKANYLCEEVEFVDFDITAHEWKPIRQNRVSNVV